MNTFNELTLVVILCSINHIHRFNTVGTSYRTKVLNKNATGNNEGLCRYDVLLLVRTSRLIHIFCFEN